MHGDFRAGDEQPYGDSERRREWQYVPQCKSPFSWTHRAIWVREVTPNLERILLTYVSTVRLPTTSCWAISGLVLPCAIRIATSRSRSVSPDRASRGLDGRSAFHGDMAKIVGDLFQGPS